MNTTTSVMMGVADMPVQTLKLLNIHPDTRSKKGKSKASDGDAGSVGGSSRLGRPDNDRSQSNLSKVSTDRTAVSSHGHSQNDNTAKSSPESPGTPSHRSQFMNQAFSDSAQRSRSPSRDRRQSTGPQSCDVIDRVRSHRKGSTTSGSEAQAKSGSKMPAGTGPGFAENVDAAMDTGKGLARIVGAGFKAPMEFSLGIAQGFHNAPKLYGADVRQSDKVTDFQSGIRTAAKVLPCY